MSEPLLALHQVRCTVAGTTVLDNVSLRTSGDRVGLSGNTLGVRLLLTGEATLVSGSAYVLGTPLSQARDKHIFGCAVALSQVPKRWPVRHVLKLAAEVSGCSAKQATARATAAAQAIGEPSLLKLRWSRLQPVEHALAALALGTIADPEVLFVCLPLGVLSAPECQRYGAALESAAHNRRLLVEIDRIPQNPCERAWVDALASFSYVFDNRDSGVGEPLGVGQARYLLRVAGDATQADSALQQAGILARPLHAPSDWACGRCAFLVDVARDAAGMADTGPLLDVCVSSNLPIIELLPV
jgi:predicted ABC-type transport system involved in lysophospholipase L1 biosynthesis ATPase subunit